MKTFDVYPLFPITPVKAKGSWVWDDQGNKYLDLYGGHAVISIGHSHPHYIDAIANQLAQIGFYSNSVQNPLQEKLAERLGEVSGYPEYQLFLCNSGAEAVENALKIASFVTGRKKIIAFKKAFHGRTSAAVATTDNPKIVAPVNAGHDIVFVPLNDTAAFNEVMSDDVAAVLIEGIQGLGGIHEPEDSFLQFLEEKCKQNNAMLILDEIQSGYGRTGSFFAHQRSGVKPHLITVAKGMGNGFPIGGVLIHPDIKPWSSMLGTTFGGNYLASVAALAVLDVIEKEKLVANAKETGNYLLNELKAIPEFTAVRGRGLMIGLDVPEIHKSLRKDLLMKYKIFTGESYPNTIRILPPLSLSKEEVDFFIQSLKSCLAAMEVPVPSKV
ncbi:MAG: aspartate aminotransferase family protein [Cyclobacteriaceae bacterium]|nr:aspartate aminotransferase family protein [Cyclobacteriaceae bacterium]UYN85942.1 MAG: aspartate aminotransferase family protein [Cyclobacteriaceae bacterium]